jgi:hypothetical protein
MPAHNLNVGRFYLIRQWQSLMSRDGRGGGNDAQKAASSLKFQHYFRS